MDNPLYETWSECYKGAKLTDWGRWEFPRETPRQTGERWLRTASQQKQAQYQYAWAVPDLAAIELLVKHSPIVEIGAGRGYWAALVQAAGGDVVCYDEKPPDRAKDNPWCPPDGIKTPFETTAKIETPVFTEILQGGPDDVLEHQDRTLFLCWPPRSEMAHEAVTAYTGSIVIYVGEVYVGDGGAMACDDFFQHMEEHFDETEFMRIPFWEGVHDTLRVFTRKGTR